MQNQEPLNPYQRIMEKTITKRIPFSATWELTYRCNLDCVHCYRVEDRRRKELTTRQAKSLIRQMAAEGVLNLGLTGGEALLREDFFELAEYARELNFVLKILTNGTLITRAVADRIHALAPGSVHMSFYAAEESLFERVTRVKGSYDKVSRAVDFLREKGVRVILKTPLMNLNHQQFRRLKSFAAQKECEILFDTKITPKNNGSTSPLCYEMDEQALEAILRKLGSIGEVPESPPHLPPCNAGFNQVTISPYGQVFPCIQLRKEAGNVKRRSFRHIWRNSPVMRQIRNSRASDAAECNSCKYADWCVRCPGLAFVETGSVNAPSRTACREARIRKKLVSKALRASRRHV